MKKITDFFGKIRKERGAALIYTLGMIALMIMLALVFATVSFSEQKTSRALTDQYAARMLAKSTVERVMTVLEKNPNILVDEIVSRNMNETVNQNHYDFLWRMLTKNPDIPGAEELYKTFFGKLITNYNPSKPNMPVWQYVYEPGYAVDSKGNTLSHPRVIGRFAYMAYAPRGLLHPTAVTAGVSNAGDIEKKVSVRPGVLLDEITLIPLKDVNIDSISSNANAAINIDNIAAFATKNYENYTIPVQTVNEFQNRMFPGMSAASKRSFSGLIDKLTSSWFAVPQPPVQPEVFWYKKVSGAAAKTSDPTDLSEQDPQRYHRFNINRSEDEWKDLFVDDLLDFNQLALYYPDRSDGGTYSIDHGSDGEYKISYNQTNCIPWIAGADMTAEQKAQLAANFLAYFAPIPANDTELKDRKLWGTASTSSGNTTCTGELDAPTYTANMRTPYLNEFTMEFHIEAAVTDYCNGAPCKPGQAHNVGNLPQQITRRYTITAEPKAHVELLDLYGSFASGNWNIKFLTEGKMKLKAIFDDTDNNAAKEMQTSGSESEFGFEDFDNSDTHITNGLFTTFSKEYAEPLSVSYEVAITTAHTYTEGDATFYYYENGDFKEMTIKGELSVPKFQMKLTDLDTCSADFAYIQHSATTYPNSSTEITSDSTDSFFSDTLKFSEEGQSVDNANSILDYQVYDARNNLNYDDGSDDYEAEWKTAYSTKNAAEISLGTLTDYNSLSGPNEKLYTAVAYAEDMEEDLEPLATSTNQNGKGGKVSTAFIRGEKYGDSTRPETPAEIGFISRGKRYQTLNLKRFNLDKRTEKDSQVYGINGAGKYKEGDANILDQLKFARNQKNKRDIKDFVDSDIDDTSNPYKYNQPGFVNLNLVTGNITNNTVTEEDGNIAAAQCVFKDIKRGTNLSNLRDNTNNAAGGEGTELDYVKLVEALARFNMTRSSNDPLHRLHSRAELLQDPTRFPSANARTYLADVQKYLLDADNSTTDAELEGAIGRIMFLLSAENSSSTPGESLIVIGIAQTIRDNMNSSKKVDWCGDGTFEFNAAYFPARMKAGYGFRTLNNGTLREVKIPYTTPTAANSAVPGVYLVGYDEITSTQKVLAWIRKDDTGRWKVERIEYVE